MKRKEQIEQAAESRFPLNPVDQSRFKDGAEWADENPSEDHIAAYLGKKGWPLSTYGIPTYEEAAKTLDEYYKYKKKQLIDKAYRYLTENCKGFILTIKDIEDFRKIMEE